MLFLSCGFLCCCMKMSPITSTCWGLDILVSTFFTITIYTSTLNKGRSFNALLKTFFFQHTGRGGAGNQGTGIKSIVIPIACWLSWCILWLMGYDYDRILRELDEEEHQLDDNSDTYEYDNSDSKNQSYHSDDNDIDESDSSGMI